MPEYVDTITSPIGFVLLPSTWIDEAHPDWLHILRGNPLATTVNFSYFSQRLRDSEALPANQLAIDCFRRLCKQVSKLFPGGVIKHAKLEEVYRRDDVCTWGCYDFWFRNERIWQNTIKKPGNVVIPKWTPAPDWGPHEDGTYVFAGRYSSIAACNMIGMLVDQVSGAFSEEKQGTVIVLGEKRTGPYCNDVLGLPSGWYTLLEEIRAKQGGGAMDSHWLKLALDAKEQSNIDIIHIEGSPVNGIRQVREEFLRELCMQDLKHGRLYPEVTHANN